MRKFILAVAITFLTACAEEKGTLLEEMTKLANDGNAEAAYHMGMFYNEGYGVEQNTGEALKWFEKSAAGGDPLGAYVLGGHYAGQYGDIEAPDLENALLNKLIAARAGYALAQYDVGVMYLNFNNLVQGEKFLKRSADQGHLDAYNTLSIMHFRGMGVPRDLVKAHSYFKLAMAGVPEEDSAQVDEILAQIESTMSQAEIAQSNSFIENWAPSPTELTLLAKRGQERSYDLVGLDMPAP